MDWFEGKRKVLEGKDMGICLALVPFIRQT